MRLGDLDALKEDFKSRLVDCNKWIENAKDKETKIRASAVKAFIGEVIMTIDNAPTVDTFTFDDMKKGINVGYKAGRLLEKWERPQGEWITVRYNRDELNCPEKSMLDFVKCPFCETIHQGRRNFCSRCGADMRKGGAE